MANVTTTHDEYDENYPSWELVEDVCEGEACVKEKKTAYLPKPNPLDVSQENIARYEQYIARAVFYNVTGRTLIGLTGAAFSQVPTLTAPSLLSYITDGIDGQGLSIYQQSQMTLSEVLQKGRCGLLADYPRTDAPASLADQQSGRIRATVALYEAESIVNWRTQKVGSKHELSLVVLKECAEEITPDGFGTKDVTQYRVLRLLDGVYVVEIWQKDEKETDPDKAWKIRDQFAPLNSSGSPWKTIPFTFVGSQSNSTNCDPSPLYDLATLNIAHYRNSADYEDSVYTIGQPQAWISGLTEQWRDWLQKQGIYVGARAVMLLPEGGAFGIAQAQPNTMAREAMDAKEAQMRAIGARLVTPGSAVKTATEAQQENEADHSVLSLACSNISEAYTLVMGWMGQWMGVSGEMAYTIHVEANKFSVDGVMLGALIAANQAGKLPDSDLFRLMRKLDVIDPEKTDEQILEELQASAGPTLGLINGG